MSFSKVRFDKNDYYIPVEDIIFNSDSKDEYKLFFISQKYNL